MSHIDADAPENEGKDFDGNFIEVEETEDDIPVTGESDEDEDEDDDVVNADEE